MHITMYPGRHALGSYRRMGHWLPRYRQRDKAQGSSGTMEDLLWKGAIHKWQCCYCAKLLDYYLLGKGTCTGVLGECLLRAASAPQGKGY